MAADGAEQREQWLQSIGNGTCLHRDRCGMMKAAVRRWGYTRRIGLCRRCVAFNLVGHLGGDRFYVCANKAHWRSDCEDVVLRMSAEFTLCRQCSHLPVGTANRPGPAGAVVILPLAVEQRIQVPDAVPLGPVGHAMEQQLQPVLPVPQPVQPQVQSDPPHAVPVEPHGVAQGSTEASALPDPSVLSESWELVSDSAVATNEPSGHSRQQRGATGESSGARRAKAAGVVVLPGTSPTPASSSSGPSGYDHGS